MIWKIVFTGLVILAVWFGYRLLGRMIGGPPRESGSHEIDGATVAAKGEDLERCAVCGAYVTHAGAATCGRDDCPHPA